MATTFEQRTVLRIPGDAPGRYTTLHDRLLIIRDFVGCDACEISHRMSIDQSGVQQALDGCLSAATFSRLARAMISIASEFVDNVPMRMSTEYAMEPVGPRSVARRLYQHGPYQSIAALSRECGVCRSSIAGWLSGDSQLTRASTADRIFAALVAPVDMIGDGVPGAARHTVTSKRRVGGRPGLGAFSSALRPSGVDRAIDSPAVGAYA